jgi:hypothetical protein
MKIKHYLALVAVSHILTACGNSRNTDASNSANSNVVPLTVDKGPLGTSINVPYVSVTVCTPGTNNCQTIDRILVDTGSTGLRLLASSLKNPSTLPGQPDASGPTLAECVTFASGYTWGPVKSVDIHIGGKTALATRIQMIGDPSAAPAPAACKEAGVDAGNMKTMNANGILGISNKTVDCGEGCAVGPTVARYYACTGANCALTTVAIANQVPNPIAKFDSDNNGSLIVFPPASEGMASLTGKLIFGIGSRANNQMGQANVYPVDASGMINGVTVDGAAATVLIDTGSTGSYFNMAGNPTVCATASAPTDKLYCSPGSATFAFPAAAGHVNITVNGNDALRYMATYPGSAVNPSLAGPTGGTNTPDANMLILGLPFYFGRSVFTALAGAQTPAATGPFVAF